MHHFVKNYKSWSCLWRSTDTMKRLEDGNLAEPVCQPMLNENRAVCLIPGVVYFAGAKSKRMYCC